MKHFVLSFVRYVGKLAKYRVAPSVVWRGNRGSNTSINPVCMECYAVILTKLSSIQFFLSLH